MMSIRQRLFVILVLMFTLCPQVVSSEADYQRLYKQLSSFDHRQVGSENFKQSQTFIINALNKAGLKTHKQLYNSVYQETLVCRLRVDGKEIEGVHPFAPNCGAPTTNGKDGVEGPLAYLGKGTADDFNKQSVRGAIVMLDMHCDKQAMGLAFAEGARSIVFVGNSSASQWHVEKWFTEMSFAIPRMFISRADAQRQGLFDLVGKPSFFHVQCKWAQAQTSNLWVHIPANGKQALKLGKEAIVLTATLDTFGIVPRYCPQKRDCANIALLVETAKSLAKETLNRDVFIVFYGSHYSAQEGGRFFYFAADKHKQPEYFDTRLEHYQHEISTSKTLLDYLKDDQARTDLSHDLYHTGKKTIVRRLQSIIDDLNFDIRAYALNEQKDEEAALRAIKANWNALRGDIETPVYDESRQSYVGNRAYPEFPEREKLYDQLLTDTIAEINYAIQSIETQIENNRTFHALATTIGDNYIVGQFSFDFANDRQDWILNYNGDYTGSLRGLQLGPDKYGDPIETLKHIYNETFPETPVAELLDYNHYAIRSDTLIYPRLRSLACFPAIASAHLGFNLNSLGDPLHYDQMPVDRECDLAGLIPQMATYFKVLGNDSRMSIKFTAESTKWHYIAVYEPDGKNNHGLVTKNFAKGSAEIGEVSVNALVKLEGYRVVNTGLIPGHSRFGLGFSNGFGNTVIPKFVHQYYWHNKSVAYNYNEYGELNRVATRTDSDLVNLNLKYVYGGGYFSPILPLTYERFTSDKALKAKTNSGLDSNQMLWRADEQSTIIYYNRDTPIKLVGSGGVNLINSSEGDELGKGFPLNNADLLNINITKQTANDLDHLNGMRLENLRKKNIVLEDIETLHANAKDHFEQAQLLRDDGRIGSAQSHELLASTIASRAYKPILDVSNDMVKAVVILLILTIPFAFSLERLFFGFTTIYKQLGGFIGFFVGTFCLLYLAHPAFSLASSPIIIFLAFVTIIMSGMVIVIVMSKFKKEILALQGLGGQSHSQNSEANTALASVVIGISGMRNRPLKTFLTALTIILLTFTILIFASFGSKIGVDETYMGQRNDAERIEVRRNSFLALPHHVDRTVDNLYQDNYHIVRRGAYYLYPGESTEMPRKCALYAPKQKTTQTSSAALAIDPREGDFNAKYKKLLPQTNTSVEHPIYLHPTAAEKLNIQIGDDVIFQGQRFTFSGNFNDSVFKELSYLDGQNVSLPDFEAIMALDYDLRRARSEALNDKLTQLDTSLLRYVPAEDTVIVTYKDLEVINGFSTGINLYPKTDGDIFTDAKDIAEFFNGPIYVKGGEGIKRFFFTPSFSAAGVSDILVPLLLGGLIIFSSLLGSIVDREREIFTFSALGLAPPNVAALFFAESAVYAVIGGLGGYIISQLAAVFLAYLSDAGIFNAPEMNFSSLSSTYTILLVMATVMLSTIVPAIKAGKSANPGIARKWKMPAPEGNTITFVFPFTVSSTDVGGILGFISEHFHNHADASLGHFAAAEVGTQKLDDINYQFSATVSLAPFDLGIFQHFTMITRQSDIKGVLEIVVELKRVSGSPGAWLRSNRSFIDDLRNQFLLWRSLPPETVGYYIEQSKQP